MKKSKPKFVRHKGSKEQEYSIRPLIAKLTVDGMTRYVRVDAEGRVIYAVDRVTQAMDRATEQLLKVYQNLPTTDPKKIMEDLKTLVVLELIL